MRFLVLTSLLVSAAAFADPTAKPMTEAKPEVGLHDDCARARAQHKDCVIDIAGGEEIDGNAPAATDTMINFLKWTKSQSLIHLRRDFVPELVKTAEDL